jgi:pimeloyl-ACP methyl ester carboxylesterase
MMSQKKIIIMRTLISALVVVPLVAWGVFAYFKESRAKSEEKVVLFSETFGEKHNPAIILNAGAGNQAITWPEKFCRKLAGKGYYVIRYDYRDSGLSSEVDYEKNPYNVLDLTDDAIAILKKYDIQKAHWVGFSMGGQIAQMAAAYRPEATQSIVLLSTSTNFKPGFDAFEGKTSKGLSGPNKEYVKFATQKIDYNKQTLEQKIDRYVAIWRLLDGSPKDFNEKFFREQGKEVYTRTKLIHPYIAHAKAMKASYELHNQTPAKIRLPALIIHGKKDPVFGLDHAKDMNKKIKGSQLIVWDNFAHAVSPQNFDRIINTIDEFLKKEFPKPAQ